MANWGSRLYRAPYLVLPRLAIESMPQNWQDRLEALLQEADDAGLETPGYYVLRDKAEPGCDPFIRGLKDVTTDSEPREFLRFHGRHGVPDPWANYRHGKIDMVCPTFKRPLEPVDQRTLVQGDVVRHPRFRIEVTVPGPGCTQCVADTLLDVRLTASHKKSGEIYVYSSDEADLVRVEK